MLVGPMTMVKAGQYGEPITPYQVLRTLEAIYGLPFANNSANVTTTADNLALI
ncbi:MAG TPA: hypothetical protein VKY19_15480 [Ktedonosporobacter sp.]|jgi:hypothetical protein|nr:hypothetical protein [Ktedonosporobacter sp.]